MNNSFGEEIPSVFRLNRRNWGNPSRTIRGQYWNPSLRMPKRWPMLEFAVLCSMQRAQHIIGVFALIIFHLCLWGTVHLVVNITFRRKIPYHCSRSTSSTDWDASAAINFDSIFLREFQVFNFQLKVDENDSTWWSAGRQQIGSWHREDSRLRGKLQQSCCIFCWIQYRA